MLLGRKPAVAPLRGTLSRSPYTRPGFVVPAHLGGDSIIPDGTFESGAINSFWANHTYDGGTGVAPTGTRAVNGTRPHTGSYSLALHKDVTTATTQEWGVVHNFSTGVLPPGPYRVGCWVYCTVANVAQIQGNINPGGTYTNRGNGSVTNAWTWIEHNFYSTGASSSIRLFIAGTTSAVDAWFDEIYMFPVHARRRGTAVRNVVSRAGRVVSLAPLRGTPSRLSPSRVGRKVAPTPSRGSLVVPDLVPVATAPSITGTQPAEVASHGLSAIIAPGDSFTSVRVANPTPGTESFTVLHQFDPLRHRTYQVAANDDLWVGLDRRGYAWTPEDRFHVTLSNDDLAIEVMAL